MSLDRGVSIADLTLATFRCHRSLRLDIGRSTVVLTGANGSGKTSVLEALSMLAPGRGLKRARLDSLAWHRGDDRALGWSVAARLRTQDGPVDILTAHDQSPNAPPGRQIRINGRTPPNQAGLADVCGVVWITPDTDRLFQDPAGARRRFLDRLVFGLDPTHASRLSAYERAMQERSRLLRLGQSDPSWLAALEETMSVNGIALALSRRRTTRRISAIAQEQRGPFPRPIVDVVGSVERWLDVDDESSHDLARVRLRSALKSSRPADGESGGATIGPHRSDMRVRHGSTGREAAACSTGEQKALLISIVLANARLQQRERGVSPLLLLDEVAAHLDDRHRRALFDAVSALDGQAWYAGTDRSIFDPISASSQFVTLGVDGTTEWPERPLYTHLATGTR
jgi:DNA replication and repair protein RecF